MEIFCNALDKTSNKSSYLAGTSGDANLICSLVPFVLVT